MRGARCLMAINGSSNTVAHIFGFFLWIVWKINGAVVLLIWAINFNV